MMIDMHAHWKPSEVADALRARTREPRIVRGTDGVEVLKAPRMADTPLAEAFNEAAAELARMDRQDVSVSVLSVLGSFCWIEAQPIDEALPLCRKVNDGLAAICARHAGRVAAGRRVPKSRRRDRQRSATQRHAGYAGKPVVGDGDAMPD